MMLTGMLDDEEEGFTVSGRLWGLLILGVILVFFGIVVLAVASLVLNSNSGSVGVVIFIGPIPIVFGSGPDSVWLILIGIILSVASVLLFLVMNRRYRRQVN
jgi:uncharacterized membrane protein